MVRAVVLWSVVAFLPQLALAAQPPGEVGALQAVFDFCTKVDPKERHDFDRQADSLFKSLTPQQITAIRKSDEYKRGYHMLATVLPGLPNSEAVPACHAISGGHEPRHGWVERKRQ
jgi:hypothetical protein